MTDDVMERLIGTAMADEDSSLAVFAWHGGEPTLLGTDFYRRVVDRQQDLSAIFKKPFLNVMQTNGATLSSEWLQFLASSKFRVGISLDGPADLHDRVRLSVSGEGTFKRVRRTMNDMRIAGLPFATLMVLTDEMMDLGPRAIWSFVVENDLNDVDLIPARAPNTPQHPTLLPQSVKLDGDRWIEFLTEMFDLWWSSDKPIRLNMFESFVRKILGGTSISCVDSGDCTGAYFGVEPTGEVYICGLYEDMSDYVVGNVLTHDFGQMRQHANLKAIEASNQQRLTGHQSCPELAICGGGCPHDHFLSGLKMDQSVAWDCCGWQPLVSHIRSRVMARSDPTDIQPRTTGTAVNLR